MFAVLFSKKVINSVILQWLFQDVVLFIIFTMVGGTLIFDMLIRINRNFGTLNSMIAYIEKLLKRGRLLSEHKNALKQFLDHFSFEEFRHAGQLIVKLVNRVAKLTEELQRQAIKDSLTNLYNRNYLNQFVNKLLGIVQRQKFPLSIAMLDIDDFKVVNDTFGHLKGDEVLKNWGKIILNSIRNSDIAVRYGGEEILLIFPNTKKDAVFYIVDRIKKKFSEIDFGIGKKVTFSAGVAGFPEDIPELKSLDDLIEIADKRLYIAKKSGKNKIVLEG
jgi:diguanylate cyclase (GGDEF)-like protein